MAVSRLATMLAVSALVRGAWCLQWSAGPEDGATLYVCEGKELALPWTVTTDTGEQIIDIEWSVHGHSDQMVAAFVHNLFLLSPSYSQRVQHLPNAGIILSHVTPGDAGNYTVEVNMDDGTGGHTTYRHTAVVHVASASIARVDASLQVVQEPVAVYNNDTDQYHVQLTCTSHGQQPPAVMWTTPSQQTVPSSSSDSSGRFSLLLDNPITGGNYTCRLPPDSPAATCLASNDPALEGSTVSVNEIKARFSVLEAGQAAIQTELKTEISDLKTKTRTLETDNNNMKGQIHTLETDNSQLKTDNSQLKTDNSNMKGQIHTLETDNNQLKTENSQLKQRVQSLEEVNSKTVIFHASLGSGTHVSHDQPIIPTRVSVNQGGGYNSNTGKFVVPHSGYYFFTVTAGSPTYSNSTNYYASVHLMVDGSAVDHLYTKSVNYWEQSTITYAAHFTRGQRVWMKANGDGNFDAPETSFCGFLVSPDSN